MGLSSLIIQHKVIILFISPLNQRIKKNKLCFTFQKDPTIQFFMQKQIDYVLLYRHSTQYFSSKFQLIDIILMGGTQSIEYAVPINEKGEDSTPVYRNPKVKDGLCSFPKPHLKTMKDIIKQSFKTFKNSNCLGKIVRPKDEKEYIEYLNYEQVIKESVILGSALINKQLFHKPEGQNLKFVGIFSRNRPEWTILDVACVLYGMVTIPIYDTLGDENISYVFNHTKLTTVFVNDLGVKALMKTSDMGEIKNIVCFDEFSPEQKSYFEEKGINLMEYSKLLKIGQDNKIDFEQKQYEIKSDDCITFSYTSGTTGPPKGAMLSHRNFTSFLTALQNTQYARFNKNDVVLSYLPLPHILERQLLYAILYAGGTIVYYSGDTQKIKEDLALVKPTIFVSVPRLFSRFYEAIQKKFDQITGYTKSALNYGLNKKLNNVSTNGGITHKIYDPIFFNRTKAALGGRVRLMISGSAPLLPDVHKFLKVVLSAPLLQAYGQTQSTGGSFVTSPFDPELAQIGGPVTSIEYKLVDIPEMKYTSNDKDEDGKPRPRGEVWMRGPGVFLGYYHNDEKTKEALTEDGWLRSGDVGAILPKTKALKIIDRKKNIFKLQQGEYVAAQKVENVYMKCESIAEVFLYGDSNQSFAIGFVTPKKHRIEEIAKEKQINGNYEQLCQNPVIRGAILAEINNVAKIEGLKSFEQAKNIYLEPLGFMMRGILTNTMKIQRHQAKLSFADEIKSLYTEGMLPTNKEKKKE